METFLFYILRTSIASAILYLFYKITLSKKTVHNHNRIVLLIFYICSFIFSWYTLDISSFFIQSKGKLADFSTLNIPTTTETVMVPPLMDINWIKIISFMYIIGIAILSTIYILSISKVIIIILKSKKCKFQNNITLCISNDDVSPFSWMKYIVISEDDYKTNSGIIISHEEAHIKYYHSLDIMLANTFILLAWFNPFAWLLRNELQTIHEYQADKKVISAGADPKEYQLLLIRKCVGEKKFMLANNFEYNHLQKRINMIMKTNSVKQNRAIYAFIPILLIAISSVLSAKNLQSEIKISKDTFEQKKDSIKKEIKVVCINDTTFITETVNGVVTTSKIVGKQSLDSIKGKRIIMMDEDEKDGKKITKKIIIFRDSTKSDVQPLYILDGKIISSEEMKEVDPNDIERIDVLKDKSATTMYGDKGKDGVILITSKKSNNATEKTIYIIDGVNSEKKVADNLNPENIITVNVLKGDNATKLYGNEAKNGVVIITTKKYSTDVNDSPVKEEVMNYIEKQKSKKIKSAKISNEGNKVVTKGISDKNSAIFIDNQLADLQTLKKMDNSKIKTINIYPISSFPELAIKYNLHKERIVQVFTK